MPADDGRVRALRVLETLAGLPQPSLLDAIAERADLPRTKAYRVLRDLQDHGYIDHVGRTGYRMGARAIALAPLIGPRPAMLDRARPVLVRLAAETGEVATLQLRSGDHRVLVLRASAPGIPVRPIVKLGERAPLTSGCAGNAILAFLSPLETECVIRAVGEPGHPELVERLDGVRRRGYAISHSANHANLSGIAAPLFDPDTGLPLGSLALSGSPAHLTDAALERLAAPLKAAGAALGPQLATVLGPSASVRLDSLDVTVQHVLRTRENAL